MNTLQLDDKQNSLVKHTVDACQNAIARALEHPSEAIGLARGLESALTSLQLVQREVSKGEAGMPAVTANADTLTRSALTHVLKLAANPGIGFAALAAMENVGPNVSEICGAPSPAVASNAATSDLPLFSEISQSYINMRGARDGEDHEEIPSLILRRQVFLDLIGDRTPDRYFPRDLQSFVNKMQHFPSNVSKRSDFAEMSTHEILEANKDFTIAPAMAKKTMTDGYLANVRTMMRHAMLDYNYHDPFAGATLSYPKAYRPSKPREGVSVTVLDRVFDNGVKSGVLDEAMFPLLAKLTSRRLGLLAYLQGSDIREKHGVWVAQTDGIIQVVNRTTELVEQLSAAPKDSLAAVDHTMAFVHQTEDAMRDEDIEASLLAAADLVETLGQLEAQRRQVVAALRQELCGGCSEPQQAEVRRLVSDRSADLAATKAARRYLQLGQMFRARRLEIDTSLPLDIVDGTKVFERIKPGADGLLLAIAAALPRGVGGMSKWSSNDLASAILCFFSGLANNVLLPHAELENGIWRVRSRHPAITAFLFDDVAEVEFLLPTTRDAETRLRDEHRRKNLALAPLGIDGRLAANRGLIAIGTRKPGRAQILISLFYNVNLPGIPTLAWRRLAEFADLGVDDRRIATLSILAGQQIRSEKSLKDWWERLHADKKGTGDLIAHILGLPAEGNETKVTDIEIAKIAVDFCFVFRIGLEYSRSAFVLSEACISALSRILPDPDSDGSYSAAEITLLLDRIVSATTTASPKGLELSSPAAPVTAHASRLSLLG